MEALELYNRLEKDFDIAKYKDIWRMDFNEFIDPQFKERQLGVMLNHCIEIDEAFTTVFPSDKILKEVLSKGRENCLLFTHHAMDWDIRKANPLIDVNKELLLRLKKGKIALYVLHTPLDKNGKWSTSVNLAKAIGVTVEEGFLQCSGVKVGIIGNTEARTVDRLGDKLEQVVHHKVKVYPYGEKFLANDKVAVLAGGGCLDWVLKEVGARGINTLVTGVTAINDFTKGAHDLAQALGINLIGATHYSTEKFACIAMTTYFEKLGIPCEFLEGEPMEEDL